MPILWAANLLVAAFFACAYLAFTSRMAIEDGANPIVTYTQNGGMQQAAYRYVGMSVAALFLQGVMAILNFGVVPFLEPDDERVAPTCAKMALASALLIMAIAVAGLAMGWPRA